MSPVTGTDTRGEQRVEFLLTLLGATHVGTLALNPGEPTDDALVATAIDFFDRYLKSDNDALDRMERHGNVPGITRLESSPNTGS